MRILLSLLSTSSILIVSISLLIQYLLGDFTNIVDFIFNNLTANIINGVLILAAIMFTILKSMFKRK